MTETSVAALAAAAIAIAVLVFLPYVFFVLELLVIPAVFAFKIAFDKPWTIEVSSGSERRRWQVNGWNRAGELAKQIADALARGDEPIFIGAQPAKPDSGD